MYLLVKMPSLHSSLLLTHRIGDAAVTNFYIMKRFFLGLVVLCTLALSGCQKGGIFGNNGEVTVNGKSYAVSAFMGSGGWWNEAEGMGWFTITVEEVHNEGIYPLDFDFSFRSSEQLKVGDEITKLSLELTDPDSWMEMLPYVEGSMTVSKFNKQGNEMTIKLKNLKMSNGEVSYVFNGTATVPYDLYPEM